MNAIDVIKRDHEAAKALFDKFKAAPEDERGAIVRDMAKALTTHELMEDTHFYPALSEVAGDDPDVEEIKGEQTSLKFEVLKDIGIDVITGEHDQRIREMMDEVLAHATKEESVILPKARALLGDEKLEELGAKMEPDSAVAHAG